MIFLPKRMFVYPAPRQSAQGRGNYSYVTTDGTQIPAGRTFAKKATKSYMFPSTPDNTKISTGLSEQIENPFKNKEFADKYIGNQWTDKAEELQSKEYISKQTFLEVVHNRPAGTYTDEKKVKEAFDIEAKENNFFERFSVSLVDDTNIFTSDDPEGALAMMLMYQNPKIANSKDTCNSSLHDFYIGQEHQALIEKSNKREKAGRAVAKLQHLKENYDGFALYKVAIVLGIVKGTRISERVVIDRLEDYIWTQSKDFTDKLDRFMSIASLLDDDTGIRELNMRYLVKQAMNTHTITISGGSFIWHSQKNIPNLYNLGRKEEMIWNMLSQEYIKYNPEIDDDNIYGKLINELRIKDIKVEG